MEFYAFNIANPWTTEWWQENLRRGVITAGFEGKPGDMGDKHLNDLAVGDWVLAYCNERGFVGAGRVLPADTYQLHSGPVVDSESDHRHERGVAWVRAVDDVADAIPIGEVGATAPRHTKERISDPKVYEAIIQGLPPRTDPDLAQARREYATDESFPIDADQDSRTRQMRAMVVREGQPRFRQELMSAYGRRCAVTGCGVVEILEAAHIMPYQGPQTNQVDNGLLLRTDIHTLFDKGLIWVDSGRCLRTANRLDKSSYADLDGTRLREPNDSNARPREEYLANHRDKFAFQAIS